MEESPALHLHAPISAPQAVRASGLPSRPMHLRLTPFGWMSCAAIPAFASTLWWQPGASGTFLAAALIVALALSWWWSMAIVRGISGRWLIPRTVHCHELTAIGCLISASSHRGPVKLCAQLSNQPTQTLARIPSVGPAASRVLWNTRFSERGLASLPSLSLSTQRPFGLLNAQLEGISTEELLVLPALGQIRPEGLEGVMSWLDEGFVANEPGADEVAHLRPYRLGDSMRRVHWRASARMRSIMVTERHAPQAHQINVYVDQSGPQRRSSRFERLICAASTTIAHFIREGWQVSLHGPWIHGGGVSGGLDMLLEHLALVECARNNADLISLPRDGACLVFTLNEDFKIPAGHRALVITLPMAEALVRMGRHIR